jgi:plastocyanin
MRALAVVLTLALGGACRSSAAPAPEPAAAPAAAPAPAAPAPAAPGPAAAAPTTAGGAKVVVAVTDEGFVPDRIPAHRGQPLTLVITRKTDRTCARDIMFQGQAGKTPLPLGKTVEVTYTPKTSGEIKFGCAMGMMVSGVLAVVD